MKSLPHRRRPIVVLPLLAAVALSGCITPEPEYADGLDPEWGAATWSNDCDRDCKRTGRCFYDTSRDRCVAKDVAECQQSLACRESGECLLDAEEEVCHDGMQRLSMPTWVAGTVSAGVGLAGLASAGLLSFCGAYAGSTDHPSEPAAPDCSTEETLVPVFLAAGTVAVNAGVAMIITGTVRIKRPTSSGNPSAGRAEPVLLVGPTSAGIAVPF